LRCRYLRCRCLRVRRLRGAGRGAARRGNQPGDDDAHHPSRPTEKSHGNYSFARAWLGKSFTPVAVSARESSLCIHSSSRRPRLPRAPGKEALLLSDGPPVRPGRRRNSGRRLRAHVGASARARRDPVPPAIDHDGIQNVFVSPAGHTTGGPSSTVQSAPSVQYVEQRAVGWTVCGAGPP
jgi:hypothetical protein